MAAAFLDAGLPAASIDGSMSLAERDDVLAGFAGGQIAVLTSCQLLSEGFDAPDSAVAMLLRPTMSRAMYRQQVGRVLRPKVDAGSAIVLDYAGNLYRHGLPTMEPRWSLDGKDEAEAEPALRTCPACGAAMAPSDRPLPSRRSGVAVTPSTRAAGSRSSTLLQVPATAWCASSITTRSYSSTSAGRTAQGLHRGDRDRRLEVRGLAGDDVAAGDAEAGQLLGRLADQLAAVHEDHAPACPWWPPERR